MVASGPSGQSATYRDGATGQVFVRQPPVNIIVIFLVIFFMVGMVVMVVMVMITNAPIRGRWLKKKCKSKRPLGAHHPL